jgi:hypothetical protein
LFGSLQRLLEQVSGHADCRLDELTLAAEPEGESVWLPGVIEFAAGPGSA